MELRRLTCPTFLDLNYFLPFHTGDTEKQSDPTFPIIASQFHLKARYDKYTKVNRLVVNEHNLA